MFKNYFKTAFRSLVRNRVYTAINISGLAVGIAVCMIIFIIIQYQLSFDDFHKNKGRIYRVLTEYHHADAPDVFYGHGVPMPLPKALKREFPQLQQVAPVYADNGDQILILDKDGNAVKKFKEENGVFFTEPSFFSIFDFPLLAGSYNTLKDPNTVLLTKEIAEKYFGNWEAAIGKTIKLASGFSTDILKVTGILSTVPPNTDFQLKLVVAFGTGFTGSDMAKSTDWDGTSSAYGCYVLLRPNTSVADFNKQLRAFSKKVKSPTNKDSHIIQALSKVRFDTQAGTFSGKSISYDRINILWLIAAFILLIACSNFINLSTAQAINRSKEVGIRKVLGSKRTELKKQFFAETFLLVLFSAVLATLIAFATLPAVNRIMDIETSFNPARNPLILLFLVLVILLVTALAGFYPSIVLSRFNPINALKNKIEVRRTKGISLRRGLVVFQFIIAQALIIATLVIIKQMNYFSNQPLGFEKETILNVPLPGDSLSHTKFDYLHNELKNIQGVQQISYSSNTPAEDNSDNWSTFRYDHAAKETDFFAIIKFSDQDYVPIYNLSVLAGRNIAPSDTVKEFLVNASVLKSLNIHNPEDILNKEISLWGDQFKGKVVGVLKDYHNRSFRAPDAPMLMTSMKNFYGLANIKLNTAFTKPALKRIEKLWNSSFPEFVFEYRFLDDKIASFYKQESQLSALYKIFAVLAIFLSCLGLYGLASFMAAQRLKEVGIRKVLGATVANVVYLFSKEFILLIAIAFAIAAPLAWYFMHGWLQSYVYRISISWWIFMIGGMASILIALATVSIQAIRAALMNPIKNLRTE